MNYVSAIMRAHFPTDDKRKMSKELFSKEINGAKLYGELELCQLLINKYLEGYNESEILGEIQKLLSEKYQACNKIFKLYKMPNYDIERVLKECEEKRNEK